MILACPNNLVMRTMCVLRLQQSRMRDVHARRMQHNALRWLLHLKLYLYTAVDRKGRLHATQHFRSLAPGLCCTPLILNFVGPYACIEVTIRVELTT